MATIKFPLVGNTIKPGDTIEFSFERYTIIVDPEIIAVISVLIHANRKFLAIKIFRKIFFNTFRTPLGLDATKDLIDFIGDNYSIQPEQPEQA